MDLGSRHIALVDGEIDLVERCVRRPEGRVSLTAKEAALLAYVTARSGEVTSRQELLVEVWGYRPGVQSRAVDTVVKQVRAKIEVDSSQPVHLLTVHGEGYLFAPSATTRPTLLGRSADLRALRAVPRRIVWLVGPSGIGKTRLALVWAADRPNRVVLRLTGVTTERELVALAARALHLDPEADSFHSLAERVQRAWMAHSASVVVLDGCDELSAAAAERLARWLKAGPRFVMTCRQAAFAHAEHHMFEVGRLSGEASRLLLYRHLPRRAVQAFEAAPDTVTAILDALAGHPVAVRLAAERGEWLSAAALLAHVHDPAWREPVHLAWSALAPPLRTALSSWACFHGPFSVEAALAVHPGADTLGQLETCHRRGLIEVDPEPPTRFRIVDALLSRATSNLAQRTDGLAVHTRRGTYLAELLERVQPEARAGVSEAFATWRELSGELPAAAARVATHAPALSVRLLLLAGTAVHGMPAPDVLALIDRVRGALAPQVDGRLEIVRAQLLDSCGRFDASRVALEAVLADHDSGPVRAGALLGLAKLERRRGHSGAAVERTQQALLALEGVPAHPLRTTAYSVQVGHWAQLGRLDEARAALVAADAAATRCGELVGKAEVLHATAHVALMADRRSEARDAYRAALVLGEQLKDGRFTAVVLTHLATALEVDDAQFRTKKAMLKRSIRILRGLGLAHLAIDSIHLFAVAVLLEGRRPSAKRLLQLRVEDSLPTSSMRAQVFIALAEHLDRDPKTEAAYQTALRQGEGLALPTWSAFAHALHGVWLAQQGRLSHADAEFVTASSAAGTRIRTLRMIVVLRSVLTRATALQLHAAGDPVAARSAEVNAEEAESGVAQLNADHASLARQLFALPLAGPRSSGR